MMRSQTPEEYLYYAWWSFLPGTVGLIATAWFAYLNLQGRRWLFWTYSGLRILSLVLHFVMPNGANFREVNAVGKVVILGESLAYPIAVPNPWMLIPHFSHLVLVIFFLDASFRCWRRGERREAMVFGTGTLLFAATLLFFSL